MFIFDRLVFILLTHDRLHVYWGILNGTLAITAWDMTTVKYLNQWLSSFDGLLLNSISWKLKKF